MNTSVNELVKDLFKEKPMAWLDRYQDGILYYRFVVKVVKYEIGVPVIEEVAAQVVGALDVTTLYLKAPDVGSSPFKAELRASELMRWIKPAAMTEGLVRLSE